jgi:predicted esterase
MLILIVLAASAALGEPNAVSQKFEPGKEARLDAGKVAGEILVYVPSDYNNDCNWPAIFYYHGQDGKLGTKWLQTATGGKGFVIVSLEFSPTTSEQVNRAQYMAYVEREIKNLASVRHFLQGKLKIDPKMTVLAGVSRGGWLAADIFSIRPQLGAAVVITCAGFHPGLAEETVSYTGKYVYVGAGEKDQNLEPAKKAAKYFESRNAETTFEIYGNLGHEINPKSPIMQKWFSDLRSKLSRSVK